MYMYRGIRVSVSNIDSTVAGTVYVVCAEPSSFGWTGYKLHHFLRAGSIVYVW